MYSTRIATLSRTFLTGTLLACVLGTPALATDVHDAVGDEVRVQRVLKTDLADGRIPFEDYLLQNFRLAFAPELADARYTREPFLMEHCLTPWIVEFTNARETLSAQAIREIDEYLNPVRGRAAMATYVSPAGLFALTYDTAGGNAVPLTDVDPANGIPDFVERCAEYYDTSWATEIDVLGFVPPVLPVDGTYDCFFANLSAGLYGFTSPDGVGRSYITIDNDFLGFGHVPSPDPDGAQLGRAKGVIAHEFKHASQRAQSGWTENNWLELDANWVMEQVFDSSDIYHAWLSDPTSQLAGPHIQLDDDGGEGYYEDLLWETFMDEHLGTQSVVDFWIRRQNFSGEAVKSSYSSVLQAYGSHWDTAYPEFMEYCWFTGSRAVPGFGFSEAADMQRMTLFGSAISTYPYFVSHSVNQLAAHHRRFNPGAATGYVNVVFDGNDAHPNFTVSVLEVQTDDTITIYHPTLDGNQDCDFTLTSTPIQDLAYVGVIVTNSKRSGGAQSYTLSVDLVPALDAPVVAAGPSFALDAAAPNPFTGSTRIGFSLPVSGHMRIDLFDVAGRRVRGLFDGTAGAERGEVTWDGTNDAGRALPAGVYWARLQSEGGT
ncbi:hypothetical protein K8I85_10550, partial [bacterium]|nr:hypothetical protein [bacterium]